VKVSRINLGKIPAELVEEKSLSVLKIADGIVVGLLCWNLFVAHMNKLERLDQQAEKDKILMNLSKKCDAHDQEACARLFHRVSQF